MKNMTKEFLNKHNKIVLMAKFYDKSEPSLALSDREDRLLLELPESSGQLWWFTMAGMSGFALNWVRLAPYGTNL